MTNCWNRRLAALRFIGAVLLYMVFSLSIGVGLVWLGVSGHGRWLAGIVSVIFATLAIWGVESYARDGE